MTMLRRLLRASVLLAICVPCWHALAQPAEGPYRLLKEIPVGGEGGWDYLSVDTVNRRLYVSHASRVVIIDIDANSIVGEIPDTPGVHGVAVAPELGRGFVSDGQANKATIFDLKTLKPIGAVETGPNPDAILYEPGHQEVYTFNGRGNSATVFDAKSGEVKATIPLPGKPEFAVVDQQAGRIYNNIEDKSTLVAIDTAAHKVVDTWPIAPGEEASGLAIDTAHHRLFIGCSNKLMEMMDSTSGKVLGSVPIGPGVDANAFDPGTGFAFASSSDGTLTVAKVDASGKLSVVQTLSTPPRSRTMTVDPKTHRLYISTAQFEAAPAPAAGEKPQRPRMVPGSFKVVVYERTAASR